MKERVESERKDALLAVVKHYGADLVFAQRTRDFTLRLFRRLQSVHRLPPQYADWLEAAAMLNEVGAYINRSGRRRHTYYIIANSELFGYTPSPAAHHCRHCSLRGQFAARGRRRRSANGSARRPGPGTESSRACCGWHAPSTRAAAEPCVTWRSAVTTDGPVRLALSPATSEGIELELWAVKRERNYFKSVFGRDLLAELR